MNFLVISTPVILIAELLLNKVIFRFRHVIVLAFVSLLYPIAITLFEALRGRPVYVIVDPNTDPDDHSDDDIITYSFRTKLFWYSNGIYLAMNLGIFLILTAIT